MRTFVVAGLVMLLAVGLANIIDAVAARIVPGEIRDHYSEVSAGVMGVFASVYGILLAFVMTVAWERHSDARVKLWQESSELVGLNVAFADLPPAERAPLQAELEAYVRSLVHAEWPAMQRGDITSEPSMLLDRLQDRIRQLPARDDRAGEQRVQLAERLHTVRELRMARLGSTQLVIPPLLAIVLLLGGVGTVAASSFVRLGSERSTRVVSSGLAGYIALMLLTTFEMAMPFRGLLRIEPQEIMETRAAAMPSRAPVP